MVLRRLISLILIICFVLTWVIPSRPAYAQTVLGLPEAGTMVDLSPVYSPLLMKGLRVHPDNPLLFDFIVDTGHTGYKTTTPQLRQESEKLIKYFLATLTIPEEDAWVNLSPYEKDRMIPTELGQTELGRDMLAQDYILKQLTASLIYPERSLGKDFWNKVYAKAQQMYGTSQVPVNTFNKVWIVGDKAHVYVKNNTAFIVAAHLKVMLEEDYLAKQKNVGMFKASQVNPQSTVASNIVRQIILPEIEKEVNEGKNFAPLRQIFYSMILASWYKKNLKQALLNQVYADKSKISGVNVQDPTIKDKIYQQYLSAYKKGVFNYIKEDMDLVTQQTIPHKYFSGGLTQLTKQVEVVDDRNPDVAMFADNPQTGALINIEAGMSIKHATDKSMTINLGLDINQPVLPQVLNYPGRLFGIKRYSDPGRAADSAKEFVKQLKAQQPLSQAALDIQKAIDNFGEPNVILALRNYFIESWEIPRNPETTNQEIVADATQWMYTANQSRNSIKDYYLTTLRGKRNLITGTTGSVAPLIVHRLLKDQGSNVVMLQRLPAVKEIQDVMGEASAEGGSNYRIVHGNLNTDFYINDAIRRMKQDLIKAKKGLITEEQIQKELSVVHFGGISQIKMTKPGEVYANIPYTLAILKALKESGVKHFIFASSATVNDISQSPYAMSKYISEKAIEEFCLTNGINYQILRPSNIGGSYQMGEFMGGDQQARLINNLIQSVRTHKPFKLTGSSNIGYISFENFSEAVMTALASSFNGVRSNTIELVPKEKYSTVQIVKLFIEFAHQKGSELILDESTKKIIDATELPKEPPSLLNEVSPVFAAKELGWVAEKSLNDIFEEVWKKEFSDKPINAHRKDLEQWLGKTPEVNYLAFDRLSLTDETVPLSTELRLMGLLGILTSSLYAQTLTIPSKDNPYEQAQREIFELRQKALKGYNPDEHNNFVDPLIDGNSEILAKIRLYSRMIEEEKDPIYKEQREYIRMISKYWIKIRDSHELQTKISDEPVLLLVADMVGTLVDVYRGKDGQVEAFPLLPELKQKLISRGKAGGVMVVITGDRFKDVNSWLLKELPEDILPSILVMSQSGMLGHRDDIDKKGFVNFLDARKRAEIPLDLWNTQRKKLQDIVAKIIEPEFGKIEKITQDDDGTKDDHGKPEYEGTIVIKYTHGTMTIRSHQITVSIAGNEKDKKDLKRVIGVRLRILGNINKMLRQKEGELSSFAYKAVPAGNAYIDLPFVPGFDKNEGLEMLEESKVIEPDLWDKAAGGGDTYRGNDGPTGKFLHKRGIPVFSVGEEDHNFAELDPYILKFPNQYGPRGTHFVLSRRTSGNAQVTKKPEAPGGIDLNPKNFQWDNKGDAIEMHFDAAMLKQFQRGDFAGLVPVILSISPVDHILPILGLKESDSVET